MIPQHFWYSPVGWKQSFWFIHMHSLEAIVCSAQWVWWILLGKFYLQSSPQSSPSDTECQCHLKCQIYCNGWINWRVSIFYKCCILTWVCAHRGNPPGVLLWSLWEVQRHGDGATRTQFRGPIWPLWQNLHPQDRPHDSHTAGKSWKMLQVSTNHSSFLKDL